MPNPKVAGRQFLQMLLNANRALYDDGSIWDEGHFLTHFPGAVPFPHSPVREAVSCAPPSPDARKVTK